MARLGTAVIVLAASLLGCGRLGYDAAGDADSGGGDAMMDAADVGVGDAADAAMDAADAADADAMPTDSARPRLCTTRLCRDRLWNDGGDVILDIDRVANVLIGFDPMVELPDGRLVVLAQAGTAANSDYAVVRFSATGQLDPSFGIGGIARLDTGAPEEAHSIEVLADGRIVGAGERDETEAQVFRMLRDGSLDTSFGGVGWVNVPGPGASFTTANGLALAASGRYLIGGQGDLGDYDFWAARLDANGTVDTSFGSGGFVASDFSGGDEFGTSIALPDGRFLFVGSAHRGATGFDCAVARHLADGSRDPSFGSAGIASQDVSGTDDRCGGLAVLTGGDEAGFLLTLDSDGAPYPSSLYLYDRALAGDDAFQALLVDRAGRLLVYGYTTNATRGLLLLRLAL
ncbi:MAG: hypothetical protein JRH11_07340 [Deltaproteobacteria bacterium]|nr:hypothetical protein [Deltaproteobacteria bacterium]